MGGTSQGEAPPVPPGYGDGSDDPIKLRREGDIPSSNKLEEDNASLEDTDTTNTPIPELKPDIGLHSKEP
ncbi:hypothetical protein J2W49_001434 [Hydrogenophaga palleronii]|uniref:Uncharacterized protein n=1 Tax=Hydrogenophaga palleronii TaxID=65655 RepID=A0ABU1WJM6_9BURK|nr:hypothetical protein [Hydrogenophaga palleronii]MDR7149485.1 hypothetical protein [Hydrogenophaga palleronii]